MRLAVLLPLMAALALLEICIGGARLLYAVPGMCLVALAGILAVLPGPKPGGRADLPCLLSAVLFAGYILLRNRLSEVEYIARLQFFIMAGCLIVYLLSSLVITKPGERKLLVMFLIFLALLQLVPALVQFTQDNQWMPLPWAHRRDHNWRATGFFISPNNFAGYMEVVALLGTSFVIWARLGSKVRVLTAYASLAAAAGVAISGSRGGYLSLTAGLGIVSLLSLLAWSRMKERRGAIVAAVVGALVVIIAGGLWWALQSSSVSERVAQIHDPENMRLLLWAAAMQQFSLSPVWGGGGFSYLYFGRLFRDPSVQNDPIHVHNDYLQLLADYGIVGAVLFALFLAMHLRSGILWYRYLVRRSAENESSSSGDRLPLVIGSLASVGAYMVHSVVDFNMQLPLNAVILALLFGVLANPGGRPESSDTRARGQGLRNLLRWSLPLLGIALLAYGIPMIRGEFLAEKSRVALRDGHAAESLEIARRGILTTRDNPELYFNAGEAAMSLAQGKDREDAPALHREAVMMFSEGMRLFPYDSRLALKLAMARALANDYYGAMDAVELAKKLDPNSSFVPAYRGIIEYSFRYYDDADSALRDSIDLGGEGSDIARKGMELVNRAREEAYESIPTEPVESVEGGAEGAPARPASGDGVDSSEAGAEGTPARPASGDGVDSSEASGDLANPPIIRH